MSAPVALRVMLSPEQMDVDEVTETGGSGFTVTITVSLRIQVCEPKV